LRFGGFFDLQALVDIQLVVVVDPKAREYQKPIEK